MSKPSQRLWSRGSHGRIADAMKSLLAPVLSFWLLPFLLTAPAASQATDQKPAAKAKTLLTPKQGLAQGGRRPAWYTRPQRIRWAPDGVHYVLRKDGQTAWVNPTTGKEEPAPGRAGGE